MNKEARQGMLSIIANVWLAGLWLSTDTSSGYFAVMLIVSMVLGFVVRKRRSSDQKSGVWVVYSYDMTAYPIAMFKEEIEAWRHTDSLGYGNVRFWEFDTEWEN